MAAFSVAEKTYTSIREMVLGGMLPPGNQMVLRNIASKLGVSLAPVRDAIQKLANEGLVHHVPGGGAFVREIVQRDLEELYTLREVLECRAAADAAIYISEFELGQLREICLKLEKISSQLKPSGNQDQFINWLGLDEKFHQVVVDAARNRLLKKVIDECRLLTRVFFSQKKYPGVLTMEVGQFTCKDHSQLIKALEAHDSQKAKKLMSEHILKGQQTVLRFLSEYSSS